MTFKLCLLSSVRSPPESTVIDPLSRPFSTRSTRSHSHVPTSPLSPLSPIPLVAASTTGATRTSVTGHPRSFSTSALDTHTYNHLRDHEGMEPLPLDYPQHEYSRLGPRSETPPLRPPKPTHMERKATTSDPQSNFNPGDPQVSATNPTPLTTGSERNPAVAGENHVESTGGIPWDSRHRTEEDGSSRRGDEGREELRGHGEVGGLGGSEPGRRSIYDTMTTDGLQTEPGTAQRALHMVSPSTDTSTGDYDKLLEAAPLSPAAVSTTAMATASPSPGSGGRKQRKSSIKIFDDPMYSPPPEKPGPNSSSSSSSSRAETGSSRQVRSASVKVIDPRYVGNYERHPNFIPPQIEIPRDQLLEKYRGNYERDPTYFSRNPSRSFSVSAASGTAISQGKVNHERRSSLTLEPAVADKYRGDYERSEDYIPPPQRKVWNEDSEADDYVLEPDPSYTGAYERHPNYVPPLIKRSSKTKIQILSTEPTSNSCSPISSDRPNHLPHEYTSLAAATKDPARQYATLNSDRSTICTLTTGSLKDSMV